MIEKLLKERIVILDGAMGTMLQQCRVDRYNLPLNDLFNEINPELIENVHQHYIDAGADIIETNTFNSNAISLAEYNLQDKAYNLNLEGARIACRAAASATARHNLRKVFVAGCMGPTSAMLTLSPDISRPEYRAISFDDMAQAYSEQVRGLIDGGADLLLVETVFDSLNARAALYAISSVQQDMGTQLPVMVSATVNDRNGNILTGQSVEALYHTLAGHNLLSFGLNCSFGAKDLKPIILDLSNKLPCAISIYPNAGLPNELGEYDETPQMTASLLKQMALEGLINIAGGCCGTTPDHIRAIAETLQGIAPRNIREKCTTGPLIVTGLSTVVVDRQEQNFINVGERTNVAGSRKFARLINEKQYEDAASIARKQIEDGASIIDINMDDPMLESAVEMGKFVRYISNDPDIAKAAYMIDSSDWETILEGLRWSPGKCIVNSISLKEGEEEFLRKAIEIRKFGAAVIVMAFDEEGQAVTFQRKIDICRRAYDLLTKRAGYSPNDIIFDVNILTIATGIKEHNRYAMDFIEAVRWIKANLPGCHTSGGVSNISFAFRGNNIIREAMHSVFLYHAIEAGLDMAIVNPSMLKIYSSIEPTLLKRVEDVVFDRHPEATANLVDLAEKLKAEAQEAQHLSGIESRVEKWREESIEGRLAHAIVLGESAFLEEDIRQALEKCSPLEIVEGALLEGMERVGELFSEGKMFLPQVIKSAKVMRNAVTILQPFMEKDQGDIPRLRRKMILATAKGDVHDIGKNILGIVLSCNNIEIIDLGVMVDNETIIEAIRYHKPDFVGVSGLITPSLHYMEELCRMLEKEGLDLPLFVGGATTSALHTAVKLAPLRTSVVIHTAGASDCANMLNRIAREPHKSIEEVMASQEQLRELYYKSNESFVSIEEARARAEKYPLESYRLPEGFGEDNLYVRFLPVEALVDKIDWNMLLAFWGFKGGYPAIVYSNPKAQKCYESAMAAIDSMIVDQSVDISIEVRFFDAQSRDETIILDGKHLFEMPRSTSERTDYGSLADFVAPEGSGITSTVGLFAIKVEDLQKSEDYRDYEHLLRESICARFAEAAAEWMQEQVSGGTVLIRPAFGYAACPDHTQKRLACQLLDVSDRIGLTLTDTCALVPTTSLCGMLISHPKAHYPHIRNKKQ